MIPVDSLTQLMGDFSLVTGLIFMQYDQFLRGEVIRKNDPKALKLFIDYIQAKLVEQGGDGHLIRESAQRVKKEENDDGEDDFRAVSQKMTFTKAFFMYHIDKFFSKEMSVVLHPIDDEYDKFLASQKKKDDDLQREIEDLDDYFLNEKDAKRSPPEVSPQPTGRKLRDQEQAPPHHEEDMPPQHQPSVAQLHLQKTIKEFESSL
jgi:hypothetical protein